MTWPKLITLNGTVGVVIGVVLCACIWLVSYVNGPAETGKVTLAQQKAASQKTVSPMHLTGQTFEFDYPAEYDTLAANHQDNTAIEAFNIGSKADYRRAIAVSVHPLPSGSLQDDSSYRLRQNDKATYQPETGQVNGEKIAIMTKIAGGEKDLFWPHNGKLLIVAITSTNPEDDLAAQLAVIRSSTHWRQ